MNSTRRRILASLGSAATLPLGSVVGAPAFAQGKTIRIYVGYPPGGIVDVVAREVGEELRQTGLTVLIENRTGASGRLATEQMLQQPADGSNIVLMPGGNITIFSHVYANLRYRLADLAPLASVCSFSFGFAAGPATPARNLKEFIDWAKANPAKASYGSPGAGTAMHFMGVMFARRAGIELTHVPYRGGAPALTDLIGGSLPALATTLANVIPGHKAGKLRVLAFSGEKQLAGLPGVPTFKELGFPELVLSETFGFYASAKTPEPQLAELERALTAAAAKPRVVAAMEKQEFDPLVLGRADFTARVRGDMDRWGPVIKSSGYRAED